MHGPWYYNSKSVICMEGACIKSTVKSVLCLEVWSTCNIDQGGVQEINVPTKAHA